MNRMRQIALGARQPRGTAQPHLRRPRRFGFLGSAQWGGRVSDAAVLCALALPLLTVGCAQDSAVNDASSFKADDPMTTRYIPLGLTGGETPQVLCRVKVESLLSASEYCAQLGVSEEPELDPRDVDGRIGCVLCIEMMVTAATKEQALANMQRSRFTAVIGFVHAPNGPPTPIRSYSGREMDRRLRPDARVNYRFPALRTEPTDGTTATAFLYFHIGFECSVEALCRVDMVVGPRIDLALAGQVDDTTSPASITGAPYDTWRFESLSPLLRLVKPAPVEEPAEGKPRAQRE